MLFLLSFFFFFCLNYPIINYEVNLWRRQNSHHNLYLGAGRQFDPCRGLSISHSSIYLHLVRVEVVVSYLIKHEQPSCPLRSTLHWGIKFLFLCIKKNNNKKIKNVFSCCDPIQLVFVVLWFTRRKPILLARFPGHGHVTPHSYISYFHIKTI